MMGKVSMHSNGMLFAGASSLALAICATSMPALAQSTDAATSKKAEDSGSDSTIIVTGLRGALQTAAVRKKNADTVMDSITATDIGAFPDKSVAEALQRVPGITVNRFAVSSDTAHFSAEPNGVIIRGLPQVRNEFNGRDTFSANSSRGLSWSDVPAELLGGVDIYKNQTADLIEGGIAGSVNLRTRVPFDAKGELIQIGAKANYGDAAKKWSPDLNAYYSNRWNTGIGEIGIMGHVAYSHVNTASLGLQSYRAGVFTGGMISGSQDVNAQFGPGAVVIPTGVNMLDTTYERKRTGVAAAAQWRSNDQKWLATFQYIRSNYDNVMREHGVGVNMFGIPSSDPNYRFQPGYSDIPVPAPGTDPFTFGQDGFIDRGTFNMAGGWWGPPADEANMALNSDGTAMIRSCYGWNTYPEGYCSASDQHGVGVNASNRYSKGQNMTQEGGFNLKYEATDNLRFNFDAQYVDSTIKLYDAALTLSSWADVELDNLGTHPRILAFNAPTNIAQSPGGLSNANNYYIHDLADNVQDSSGQEVAMRFDGEWNTPFDWADTVKFGVRYADRDQRVQGSSYNWANIANTWTQGCQYIYFNADSKPGSCTSNGVTTTFNGYPANFYKVGEFGNPFFGGSLGMFPHVPFSFLANHQLDLFSREKISNPDPITGAGGIGSFIPVCSRNGQPGTGVPTEMPNSCFAQNEIADVSETTRSAYLMVKFGGNDTLHIGGVRVSGNIGVRYINTRVKSLGFEQYPRLQATPETACPSTPLVPGGLTGNASPPPLPQPGQPVQVPYSSICYMSPEDVQFAMGDGTGKPINIKVSQNHILPSFNLRFDFSPKWVMRLAASKAMSRPDMGLLRSYLSVSQNLPGTSPDDPRWIKDAQGNIIGAAPEYMASAFNARLKPTTAWQFDVSLEHYFANAGMFSLALFHKQFYDYIQFGRFFAEVTNNGVTRTVQVSGPANGKGAKIQGAEVAYNRFFDFLPEPFNHFGIQANYTFIRNKGVPNSNLASMWPGVYTPSTINPGSLEGLSKHSFNLVGLFEKGPFGARLAYNWRSRYLITAADCCVGLPVWSKALGYLDGSIRYSVNKNIELSIEGSNLLNTKTVTEQQMSDSQSPEGKMILMQNSWFRQDRRFTFGVRWKMGG